MKIILPPHLKVAQKTSEINVIVEQSEQIFAIIKDNSIYTLGSKYQDCLAVAQPQVSDKPLRFFVLNPAKTGLVKEFGAITIINPRLISKDRRTRYMNKEACLSYPMRPQKKVKRFLEIVVEYDILENKGRTLKQISNKPLNGLAAMVFQHEMEHLAGKSVWAK